MYIIVTDCYILKGGIMLNSLETIKNLVSVTRFSRGEARQIFEEVKDSGMKVVVKNGAPICVMLSIPEYEKLVNKIEKGEESNGL